MFDNNLLLLTVGLPILITVVVLVFVGIFVGRLVMNGMQNRDVLSHGESAPAQILKAWQTGTVMNEVNPQIGLLLQVQPTNRPAFQAEAKMFISMLQIPQFQPGTMVQVKYDPKNPSKVAVDTTGGAAVAQTQAANPERVQALQAVLEQMKTMENDLSVRGVPAKAMILTASDTQVKVNGENPWMTFQLQVQPTDRAPYQATAQGVVGAIAVSKFQPGATVWVKYDPNDPSKVVLDHS